MTVLWILEPLVLSVTVHPSPPRRRCMPPSGCSCKTYSQESTPCCTRCRPWNHRLGGKRQKHREEGSRLMCIWGVFSSHIAVHNTRKGDRQSIWTHLVHLTQTPDSCWCPSRCRADTSEIPSHRRTCLSHKFHSKHPVCCSTLSWQGSPSRAASRQNCVCHWQANWGWCRSVLLVLWTTYTGTLPGFPSERRHSHRLLRVGSRAED